MSGSTVSRRAVLTGAGLLAAERIVRPAAAIADERLRTGDTPSQLATPAFPTRLDDPRLTRLAGVRPHRRDGVRLDASVIDRRVVVNNYGHSGAGITLSWGCADDAAALARDRWAAQGSRTPPRIGVVGAGIIGLTTATRLREAFPRSTIIVYSQTSDARSTTSWVAGGQFEPSFLWRHYDGGAEDERLARWLTGTRRWIDARRARSEAVRYGIAQRRNYMLSSPRNALDVAHESGALACPTSEAACRSTYEPVRGSGVRRRFNAGTLPFDKLGEAAGQEYFTWLINPQILMPQLKVDLTRGGVRFRDGVRLQSKADLLALPADIIANCAGLEGARLAEEPNGAMQPIRGHILLLANPSAGFRYFFSGGCGPTRSDGSGSYQSIFYMFGRQRDIVIGGSAFYGDARPGLVAGDDRVFAKILANARRVFSGMPKDCVDTDDELPS